MKKIFFLSISLLILIGMRNSLAQIPTYNLRAMNFQYFSINFPNDALEFDIYIEHTNPSTMFEYLGGQYFISFNHNLLTGTWPPGGKGWDTSEFSFKIIGSDLPLHMISRFPSVYTATNPTADIMRLGWNTPIGVGDGYIIPNNGYPGTKIVRMKLWNKTSSFNNVSMNLAWRNPPIQSNSTKIFAAVGTVVADITTPNTHCIDTMLTNVNSNNIIPPDLILHQNYPNPFNPKTIINYELRITNFVSLKIYDVSGKEVETLVNQKQNAGRYEFEWYAKENASGIYYYKLSLRGDAGDFTMTKQMVLIK